MDTKKKVKYSCNTIWHSVVLIEKLKNANNLRRKKPLSTIIVTKKFYYRKY